MTQWTSNDRGGEDGELQERVVQIRRVAKVVKGGRNLTFNAMVVVGDGAGRVGVGLGKGKAVPDAIRKGNTIARNSMVTIPLKGSTVAHSVNAHFGASRVLIRPAQAGSGVKAGGAVRAVMEAVGVKDVVAKALGSRNPINVVKATLSGLLMLQGSVEQEPLKRAVLPAAPERRGPMRREGGGGFRGRDRDRDRDRDRRPPGGYGGPRPSSGPPAAPPAAAPAAAPPAPAAPPSEAPPAAAAPAAETAAPVAEAPQVTEAPVVEETAVVEAVVEEQAAPEAAAEEAPAEEAAPEEVASEDEEKTDG